MNRFMNGATIEYRLPGTAPAIQDNANREAVRAQVLRAAVTFVTAATDREFLTVDETLAVASIFEEWVAREE